MLSLCIACIIIDSSVAFLSSNVAKRDGTFPQAFTDVAARFANMDTTDHVIVTDMVKEFTGQKGTSAPAGCTDVLKRFVELLYVKERPLSMHGEGRGYACPANRVIPEKFCHKMTYAGYNAGKIFIIFRRVVAGKLTAGRLCTHICETELNPKNRVCVDAIKACKDPCDELWTIKYKHYFQTAWIRMYPSHVTNPDMLACREAVARCLHNQHCVMNALGNDKIKNACAAEDYRLTSHINLAELAQALAEKEKAAYKKKMDYFKTQAYKDEIAKDYEEISAAAELAKNNHEKGEMGDTKNDYFSDTKHNNYIKLAEMAEKSPEARAIEDEKNEADAQAHAKKLAEACSRDITKWCQSVFHSALFDTYVSMSFTVSGICDCNSDCNFACDANQGWLVEESYKVANGMVPANTPLGAQQQCWNKLTWASLIDTKHELRLREGTQDVYFCPDTEDSSANVANLNSGTFNAYWTVTCKSELVRAINAARCDDIGKGILLEDPERTCNHCDPGRTDKDTKNQNFIGVLRAHHKLTLNNKWDWHTAAYNICLYDVSRLCNVNLWKGLVHQNKDYLKTFSFEQLQIPEPVLTDRDNPKLLIEEDDK